MARTGGSGPRLYDISELHELPTSKRVNIRRYRNVMRRKHVFK
jgi:hypothetical protein